MSQMWLRLTILSVEYLVRFEALKLFTGSMALSHG
jgi:hypothetical protein